MCVSSSQSSLSLYSVAPDTWCSNFDELPLTPPHSASFSLLNLSVRTWNEIRQTYPRHLLNAERNAHAWMSLWVKSIYQYSHCLQIPRARMEGRCALRLHQLEPDGGEAKVREIDFRPIPVSWTLVFIVGTKNTLIDSRVLDLEHLWIANNTSIHPASPLDFFTSKFSLC